MQNKDAYWTVRLNNWISLIPVHPYELYKGRRLCEVVPVDMCPYDHTLINSACKIEAVLELSLTGNEDLARAPSHACQVPKELKVILQQLWLEVGQPQI